MKTLFLSLFAVIVLSAMGQNEKSGVYLTFNDYLNNKLSYEIDCKTEKHTIKLNEFLNKPYITIIHKGEKYQLQKDSIYGFISCDAPLVRFQNKEHYWLSEKGATWIFYKEENKTENKTFYTVKKYYFSIKGDGKLIELTKENLKYAFPDNHKFHDMLDAQFKDNSNIAEFDSFHNMFKVNHLLEQSLQGCKQ